MPDFFRAKAYKRVTKTTPRPDAEAGPYNEPAEAVDWAEEWLTTNGLAQESFVDVYFNGDSAIHTSVYYLNDDRAVYGIANSSHARWPITYLDDDSGMGIELDKDEFGRDLDEWKPGDSDEDEISDDADELDLSADRKDANDEDKGDEDEEEEDGADDEIDEDRDDSASGDSDEDSDEGDEADEDKEEPRMTIFGKFRGPKGWRKRAETDPENEINRFAIKFGVLDESTSITSRQERDTRVEVRFIERDTRRDAGELRIRVPDGVSFRDEGKWLVAEIPYKDLDDEEE